MPSSLYYKRLAGSISISKPSKEKKIASPALMAPISHDFIARIQDFISERNLDLVRFKKGQRKDDITKERLKKHNDKEGILYVGVAQEKFSTFRLCKTLDEITNCLRPSLYRSQVMCNQYYFYIFDEDFGPMFIKFGSYFPYTARICLNGHEYLKDRLKKEEIRWKELDNGILSCSNPARMQAIANGLTDKKIRKLIRKWFNHLPSPIPKEEKKKGIDYELSILQAELACTQVFDKPVSGRLFFENIIKENLDLGRPENVSLIFDRRVTKRTPGEFRTRIITQNVIPSLHVSYKNSKIKQYFKCEKALRTETVINNTRDFGIGRLLKNFSSLKEKGFSANQRLLNVQKLSQNCIDGNKVFNGVINSVNVNGQRASALKFGDERVMMLFHALIHLATFSPEFSNSMLRECLAKLLSKEPDEIKQGQMTYDLRRLRLHGILTRLPRTNKYIFTPDGLRIVLFFAKTYSRIFQNGFAQIYDSFPECENKQINMAFSKLEKAIDLLISEANM